MRTVSDYQIHSCPHKSLAEKQTRPLWLSLTSKALVDIPILRITMEKTKTFKSEHETKPKLTNRKVEKIETTRPDD